MGKLYRGDEPKWLNQVGCYEDGKIYKGDEPKWLNQVGCYDGEDDGAAAAALILGLL